MIVRKPLSETTVDDLIEILNTLQESDDIEEDMGRFYFKSHPELSQNESDVVYCESLCNEFLITTSGGCNLENINRVREAGYRVYAGEKDSFGWLTGCVENEKTGKILVYG